MCQLCYESSAAQHRKNWLVEAVERLEKFNETDPDTEVDETDPSEMTCIHTQLRLMRDIIISMYHDANK